MITMTLDTFGSIYPPWNYTFGFCQELDSVKQDEGQMCPPEKGNVEIKALPFTLLNRDLTVTVRFLAETAEGARITCINATLEIRGPYGSP